MTHSAIARIAAARWARALFAALCVGATLSWLHRQPPSHKDFYSATSYVDIGESLIHRVPASTDVSHRMPLSTIMTAWLRDHHGVDETTARFVLRAIVLVLALACGALLLSAGFPVFCAAFCLLYVSLSGSYCDAAFQEAFFAALTAGLAGLLVWRAQEPSGPRTFFLGLGVGLSLLFRSVFAFLPPFLFLLECLRPRREPRRLFTQFLLLCVWPYVWLLPWIKMNWALHRRIVLFEHQGADMNIVAGVLGVVQGFSVYCKDFVGSSEGSVLMWGLREVAQHPARYAAGVLHRIAFAVSLHPWLFVAAVIGGWVYRKRPECRALLILGGYYLVLYCLLAVVPRYFEPLCPILSLLAAALPARLLEAGPVGERGPASLLAAAVPVAGLAVLLPFAVYAEAAVWSSPVIDPADAASRDAAVSAAILRSPSEPWPWGKRGEDLLHDGRLPGAADAFERALALAPGDPGYALQLAWVRSLQAAPRMLSAWAFLPQESSPTARNLNQKARLYLAASALRRGRLSEAKLHSRAFIDEHRAQMVLPGLETRRGSEVVDAIISSDAALKDMVVSLLRYRPVDERLALLETMSALGPRFDLVEERSELLRRKVEEALRLKKRREAARLLHTWEGSSKLAQELHSISLRYQELGLYAQQCRLLRRLVQEYPHEALYRSDLGVCLALSGSYAQAIESLRAAIRCDEKFLPAYQSLGALLTAGNRRPEAVDVYEQALRRSAAGDRLRGPIQKSLNELRRRSGRGVHSTGDGIQRGKR